jgi:hypothetical protein
LKASDGRVARNTPGHRGRAAASDLLSDLQVLAIDEGSEDDFAHRLASIRARHEKKRKFIERLTGLGRDNDERTA